MRRDQLEYAIRTACQIIHQSEVIVVGSQAILGAYAESQLPAGLAGGQRPKCQIETVAVRTWSRRDLLSSLPTAFFGSASRT